jgi:hypothetical protein
MKRNRTEFAKLRLSLVARLDSALLRFALGVGLISAVADRLGLWAHWVPRR